MAESMEGLLEIAEKLVARAGADEQVEVYAARGRDTEIRVYRGEVESFSAATSEGAGVRVIADHRQGFAYSGGLSAEALDETLEAARDNARFATVDESLGLVEPDGVDPVPMDLWDESLVGESDEAKIGLCIELERAALAADGRISGVESADYSDSLVESVVVSSRGVSSTGRYGSCDLTASVLATEDDETQTGFGWSVGRRLADLNPGIAASDAAERATRLLGAEKPASQRTVVVLDPYVTAMFLSIIGSTLTGEAVQKGRSLFANRLGEAVASPFVTLVDDPTDARAYTAGPIDAEGLATRRNDLIEAGVLRGFLHNGLTARRAGTSSTGSAVRGGFRSAPGVGARALQLLPGTASQDELISGIDSGVLVQSVSGLHSGVNPVSGDFSTGAEGMRISGGAIAGPLREFTIGSTLQRMLADVEAIGGDVDWLPMSAAGVTLVVGGVTVSGL